MMVATDFRLLHWVLAATFRFLFEVSFSINKLIIPPLPGGCGGYTVLPLSFRPSKIFFSATIDDRNLIYGHKLHIGTPYRGKHFWTHQIPTSCLPTWLVFMHIEHICGGIISEH